MVSKMTCVNKNIWVFYLYNISKFLNKNVQFFFMEYWVFIIYGLSMHIIIKKNYKEIKAIYVP